MKKLGSALLLLENSFLNINQRTWIFKASIS
jgi:hypothetical protein